MRCDRTATVPIKRSSRCLAMSYRLHSCVLGCRCVWGGARGCDEWAIAVFVIDRSVITISYKRLHVATCSTHRRWHTRPFAVTSPTTPYRHPASPHLAPSPPPRTMALSRAREHGRLPPPPYPHRPFLVVRLSAALHVLPLHLPPSRPTPSHPVPPRPIPFPPRPIPALHHTSACAVAAHPSSRRLAKPRESRTSYDIVSRRFPAPLVALSSTA